MILLFLGAAFGFYKGVKSFIEQWNYFKQFIGNPPINHLFKRIKKQDGKQMELQYFDKMYITGQPIMKETQNFRSIFNMIYFQQTIIDNLEVEINVPQRVFFVMGEKHILFGDFIYNSKSQVLRCNRIRDLFIMKELNLNKINSRFYLRNIMLMLLQIGIIGICLYIMFKIGKIITECNGQINYVLISKYHQQTKCKICNNHNSNIIALPCQHLICCQECFGRRNFFKRYLCPYCNTVILRNQQIFNH